MKNEKNTNDILTTFYMYHKSGTNIFLKWFINTWVCFRYRYCPY